MKKQYLPALLIAATAWIALPSIAQAQVSNLDPATLIEALRKEGMADLLRHMVETEVSDDPALAEQALINQLLLEYSLADKKAKDPNTDPAEAAQLAQDAKAFFYEALDKMREAITTRRDNPQRPLWQTNLVEQLLFEDLQALNSYAAEFYEYGVPTREQIEAFEANTMESLVQITDADLGFFKLMGEVPRRPDFKDKFENSGLWARLRGEFYGKRTQYFLAVSAYLATLVPDSHEYYQTLGSHPLIPAQLQAKTPAAEKQRLRDLTIDRMKKMLSDNNDLPEVVILQAKAIMGRAEVARGNVDEGIALLEEVIEKTRGKDAVMNLMASLARVSALAKKDYDAAMAALLELDAHPTMADLRFRLLKLDMMHKLMLAQAMKAPEDQRKELVSQAYQPYVTFFSNPPAGVNPALLKNYIFRRWEANLKPEQKLEELPHVVLLGIGEIARANGQDLNYAAQQADDEQQQQEKIRKAMESFDRCIKVNDVLLAQEGVDPTIAAWGMYNKALSIYFKDPGDFDNMTKAASVLVDIGEKLPGESLAVQSMTEATNVLQPLHANPQGSNLAKNEYLRAMGILLDKFPDAQITHDNRVYYAYYALLPANRHVEAAQVLSNLPATHPNYWIAQREILHILQNLYQQARSKRMQDVGSDETAPEADASAEAPAAEAEPVADAESAAEAPPVAEAAPDAASSETQPLPGYEEAKSRLVSTAEQIIDDAEMKASMAGDPETLSNINAAAGAAKLVIAEVAIDDNDPATAARVMEGFLERHGEDDTLIQQGLATGIWAYAATGDFEQATEQAQRMMRDYPNQASSVIDNVLKQMETRISSLRQQAAETLVQREKDALNATAVKLAQAATSLARLLLDWANAQQLEPEELLPYQMILARAMLVSGKPQAVLDFLLPIYNIIETDENGVELKDNQGKPKRKFGNDADMLINLAEAYFALGGDANLLGENKAAALLDKIITGMQPDPETQKYPDVYWRAWMRRLQINERLGKYTEDISRIIEGLERADPTLGGEPYRRELKRLQLKYLR